MTETKHTEGAYAQPWTAREAIVFNAVGEHVAVVRIPANVEREEAQEVARLIAAAPEMLRWLQRIVDAKPEMLHWMWIDNGVETGRGWGDEIQALLAKARGEAQDCEDCGGEGIIEPESGEPLLDEPYPCPRCGEAQSDGE